MKTVPDLALATIDPADAAEAYQAGLRARHAALEAELEAAPFHRVNTRWWEERTKEMHLIDQRLRA